MNISLKYWINSLKHNLSIALPSFCVSCEKLCQGIDLCSSCSEKLPWITHLSSQSTADIENIQSLFSYEMPVSQWIHRYKFRNRLHYSLLFADLMQQHLVLQPTTDMIVSVPLHKKRLQERGYNQSSLIAKRLAKYFQLPYAKGLLYKHKNTAPQHALSSAKRQNNLKNTFSISSPNECIKKSSGILLIDDVITTGITINEIARTIRKHSDCPIQVWSICRKS